MDNVKVEPAVDSYRVETEKAWTTVLSGFSSIMNALNDLEAMPTKYAELETKLTELAGSSFGDSMKDKMDLYKLDRTKYLDFLKALDMAVAAEGMMLV